MEFLYSEKEKKHSKIMEKLAVTNRSNKEGFKEGLTFRIDAIRDILLDSGYHEVLLPHTQIWRKDFSTPIDVVVSSHSDVVSSISSCSSSLSNSGYYKGTYDNAGTNAAAVIAMLEGDIAPNVAFAFTADEETGRCNGARQTLEYFRNTGNEPVCIALDVTYEGYDNGEIFTVENLSSGHKKHEDKDFINKIGEYALRMEPEGMKTCTFVRLHKDAIPEAFPKSYIAKDSGWFDEAQFYAKQNAKTFSLCLPCDGNMHGNSGVKVRQPEFEGYVNALKSMVYSLSKDNENLIDGLKEENKLFKETLNKLVEEEEAKAAEERKARQQSYGKDGYLSYLSKPYSYGSYGYKPYSYGSSGYSDYKEIDDYNRSFDSPYSYGSRYDMEESETFFDPEIFNSFEDYIDSVIDEVYEMASYYDPTDKFVFVRDAISYLPRDFKEWLGTEENLTRFLVQMFEENFEEEQEIEVDDEEIFEEDSLRRDSDGYEYEKSILDYLDQDMKDEYDYEDEDDDLEYDD